MDLFTGFFLNQWGISLSAAIRGRTTTPPTPLFYFWGIFPNFRLAKLDFIPGYFFQYLFFKKYCRIRFYFNGLEAESMGRSM